MSIQNETRSTNYDSTTKTNQLNSQAGRVQSPSSVSVTHINGIPCNVDMKTNLLMTFVMSIYFCNFKVWMSFGGYVTDYFGISFSLLTFIFVLAKIGRISMMPISRWFGRFRINRFLCVNFTVGALMLYVQTWLVVDDYVYEDDSESHHHRSDGSNNNVSEQTLLGKMMICLSRMVYITLLFAISAQYQSCLKSATQNDQKRFQQLNSLYNSAFTIGTLLFFPTGFILKHLGFVWFLRISALITFACGVLLLFVAPPFPTDDVCNEIKLRKSQMNLNTIGISPDRTTPIDEETALLRTDGSDSTKHSSLMNDLMDMFNDEARVSVLLPGMFVAWSWGVYYTVFGPYIKSQFNLEPQILGTVLTLSEGIGQIFALLSVNFLFQSTLIPSRVVHMIFLGSVLEVGSFLMCYLFIAKSLWLSCLGCLIFFTGHESLFLCLLTCLQNFTKMESMAFTITVYFVISYTIMIGVAQVLISFLFGSYISIFSTLIACMVSSSIGGILIIRMDHLAKKREREEQQRLKSQKKIQLMNTVFVDSADNLKE